MDFLSIIGRGPNHPKMAHNIFRDGTCVVLTLTALYYVVMDIILYCKLQITTLVSEAESSGQLLHPLYVFHPMTIRLLVLDQTNQYIIKPIADNFNYVTGLYNVVSSNAIMACHGIVSVFVGKLVSSDSLRIRKMGVVLFEVRTWLVCLTGIVYRCRSGSTIYTSYNGVYGATSNTVFDVIEGLFFCAGVCFGQLQYFQRRRDNGYIGASLSNQSVPTKANIIGVFCTYGFTIVAAYSYLAFFIIHLEKFFEQQFPDANLTTVQTTLLHSVTTCVFLWLWRFFTQQMFQYLAVAVFLDRTWDFMKKTLFFFVASIVLLMSVCYIFIVHMNSLVYGGEFNS